MCAGAKEIRVLCKWTPLYSPDEKSALYAYVRFYSMHPINPLTDVIWLIGIDRRLGTQLASSLCPEPSVPINQMTPAFNIWGLFG
ncbi:hypothetical protein TYRP_019321, partial [Tyrophagus putrescentiae]